MLNLCSLNVESSAAKGRRGKPLHQVDDVADHAPSPTSNECCPKGTSLPALNGRNVRPQL